MATFKPTVSFTPGTIKAPEFKPIDNFITNYTEARAKERLLNAQTEAYLQKAASDKAAESRLVDEYNKRKLLEQQINSVDLGSAEWQAKNSARLKEQQALVDFATRDPNTPISESDQQKITAAADAYVKGFNDDAVYQEEIKPYVAQQLKAAGVSPMQIATARDAILSGYTSNADATKLGKEFYTQQIANAQSVVDANKEIYKQESDAASKYLTAANKSSGSKSGLSSEGLQDIKEYALQNDFITPLNSSDSEAAMKFVYDADSKGYSESQIMSALISSTVNKGFSLGDRTTKKSLFEAELAKQEPARKVGVKTPNTTSLNKARASYLDSIQNLNDVRTTQSAYDADTSNKTTAYEDFWKSVGSGNTSNTDTNNSRKDSPTNDTTTNSDSEIDKTIMNTEEETSPKESIVDSTNSNDSNQTTSSNNTTAAKYTVNDKAVLDFVNRPLPSSSNYASSVTGGFSDGTDIKSLVKADNTTIGQISSSIVKKVKAREDKYSEALKTQQKNIDKIRDNLLSPSLTVSQRQSLEKDLIEEQNKVLTDTSQLVSDKDKKTFNKEYKNLTDNMKYLLDTGKQNTASYKKLKDKQADYAELYRALNPTVDSKVPFVPTVNSDIASINSSKNKDILEYITNTSKQPTTRSKETANSRVISILEKAQKGSSLSPYEQEYLDEYQKKYMGNR